MTDSTRFSPVSMTENDLLRASMCTATNMAATTRRTIKTEKLETKRTDLLCILVRSIRAEQGIDLSYLPGDLFTLFNSPLQL